MGIETALSISRTEGAPELIVVGELDMATAPSLLQAIEELGSAVSGEVTLDLSAVEFIDSSGLAALLSAARDRSIRLRSPSPQVQHLLTLTKLDGRIPTVDGTEEN